MRQLTLATHQPLRLATRPEASFYSTTDYVLSGTQIRGAMARRWIAENVPPQSAEAALRDQFVALFHGDVSWPWLMADGVVVDGLSELKHKYPTDCTKRADLAVAVATDADLPDRLCECGGWLVPGKGVNSSQANTTVVAATRAELESVGRRERARDGNLYSREALVGRTRLSGHIIGDHPWLQSLQTEDGAIEISVGGQRSIGGSAVASIAKADPPALPIDVLDHPTRLVLRLMSPGVFVGPGGEPSLEPSAEELTNRLGVDCEIKGRWARPTEIGGWDFVSGLPKPVEIAAIAGSTWLVELSADPRIDDLEQLLASSGIGLRRSEGFGRVELVSPVMAELPAPDGGPHIQGDEQMNQDPALPPLRQIVMNITDAFGPDRPNSPRRWILGKLTGAASSADPGQLLSGVGVAALTDSQKKLVKQLAELNADDVKRVAVMVEANL